MAWQYASRLKFTTCFLTLISFPATNRLDRSPGDNIDSDRAFGATFDESPHLIEGRRHGSRRGVERQSDLRGPSIQASSPNERQLVEDGFEAVLTRKSNPKSARPRIFDGPAEAKLTALACGQVLAGHAK